VLNADQWPPRWRHLGGPNDRRPGRSLRRRNGGSTDVGGGASHTADRPRWVFPMSPESGFDIRQLQASPATRRAGSYRSWSSAWAATVIGTTRVSRLLVAEAAPATAKAIVHDLGACAAGKRRTTSRQLWIGWEIRIQTSNIGSPSSRRPRWTRSLMSHRRPCQATHQDLPTWPSAQRLQAPIWGCGQRCMTQSDVGERLACPVGEAILDHPGHVHGRWGVTSGGHRPDLATRERRDRVSNGSLPSRSTCAVWANLRSARTSNQR
jgi:hypothetical protein